MNLVTVSIDEFPQDGAPWRIDGLGRLHGTGSSRSEPLIDVHLSQLLPDYGDPLSNLCLTQSRSSKRIPIKVGLIALLKPGSVWINKVRCPPRQDPKSLSIRITWDQVELHTWGSTVEFEGRTIPLIDSHQFFVPKDNWRDLIHSWVGLIRRPLPDVPYLIIPSSVIFQKCFAESSKGVRKLLCGELEKIIDEPSQVETDDGVKTFFVELAKEIRSIHAYPYANLVADPKGQQEYERMRRTLMVASANENRAGTSPRGMYLKLGLPFSNPVDMLVHGKRMPFFKSRWGAEPEFAFLATEIVSLDVRLVFDRLIVARKNSGKQGPNAGDPDLKDAWTRASTSPLDLDDEEDVAAVSDEEPLSDFDKLIAEEAGGFKPPNLEIVHEPKLVQEYRSRLIPGNANTQFDGTATTGVPTSGEQGAAELDVQTNEAPRVPVTLDGFIETLQILREAGHAFETRLVAHLHRFSGSGDVVNFFPRNLSKSRSWHLVSDDPHAPPRGYIVATCFSGGVWHHFIELERKNESGRSLAHVRTQNGALIEDREMRIFMLAVAHERGWNAASLRPNWSLATINHSPKKGLHHFARAIAKAIGATLQKT